MAKKVLVVDDEKLIVKGIRFSLEQDGMEVDCAYDGEEALKMATENAYDMILLDERRGILHVRRHLAASPLFKGIPNFKDTRIAMLRAETLNELNGILDHIEATFGKE